MIVAEGIYKHFRSGTRSIRALENVSLEVGRGEGLVISGKSGSGKTTLLHCLGGLEAPDKGQLLYDGIDLGSLSSKALSLFIRKNVGFVFQRSNLFSFLTVRENIAFPLELNDMGGAGKNRRIDKLLRDIGTPDLGPAFPHEISGGEMQRVAFARAIAHKPAVLLADEPTASLDTDTGRLLVELMISMSGEQKCAIIIASHDPDIVRMADKTLFIKDGKVEVLK